ncbi:MAG TPA: crossover junction endodeoxyribonuclease RuvC [Parachlamydiaceae bacterium]|nr:crossover junction endodeoxyribonuclease RuvC [Parachlamydiaceae bacterium]
MLILGIDPGTLVTGYGLVSAKDHHFSAIDYGCIRPSLKDKLTDRYLYIYNGIKELLEKYQPDALVVETQFVNKNPQSAIKLGMARGIIILAAKKRGISVFEYAPTKIKLAVAGKGKASKFEVQRMVQLLLKLSALPEPEDAADALAAAICHANTLVFSLQPMEI